MNESMNESIIVFTDGSFSKNKKGEIKSGYGIYFPNNELPNISRPFTHLPLTNQRAELYAIYKAIYLITKKLNIKKIQIFTDSRYSINSLTTDIKKWKLNGWKTTAGTSVKNQDLIKKIDKLMLNFKGIIEFNHVKSHTNNKDGLSINNQLADELAKRGALIKNLKEFKRI